MNRFDALRVVALLALVPAGGAVGCRAQAAPPGPEVQSTKEAAMKPVTIINRLSIKPGMMDSFIDAQQRFAAEAMKRPNTLIGGRMYKSLDGRSAVLVSTFASMKAQEELLHLDAFKEHVSKLQAMVESSSPNLYEEAYTTGDFR
jgi:hypothetical protein